MTFFPVNSCEGSFSEIFLGARRRCGPRRPLIACCRPGDLQAARHYKSERGPASYECRRLLGSFILFLLDAASFNPFISTKNRKSLTCRTVDLLASTWPSFLSRFKFVFFNKNMKIVVSAEIPLPPPWPCSTPPGVDFLLESVSSVCVCVCHSLNWNKT